MADGSGGGTKNIILLLDGTWNDADYGNSDTNIVRLRERISQAMQKQTAAPTDVSASVQAGHVEGRQNVVLYQRGVGTNALDRFRGGAFGAGLNHNVRDAYRFICANYEPGDKLFLFGFSRGAFTARSVAGYIAAAGILKPETCTPGNESRAWYYYRERPSGRMSGIAAQFKNDIHPYEPSPITCLGIFDTVGAMGVPFKRFSRINRSLYEFHDVYLSGVSKVNLQALAIDEHRWPFEAALWRQSKFVRMNNRTEQAWFAGCHSDVGGGNVDEAQRVKCQACLDDVTLDWMLKRLSSIPETKEDFPARPTDLAVETAVKATQEEARQGIYRFYPFAYRTIGSVSVPRKYWHRAVGYDRHNSPQSEAIHISAIQRFGELVSIGYRKAKYLPENLKTYLLAYNEQATPLPIVDWNGAILDKESGRSLVEKALARG
jgi:hypothetical protein